MHFFRRSRRKQIIIQDVLRQLADCYSNPSHSPQSHQDIFKRLSQVNSHVNGYKCLRDRSAAAFIYCVHIDSDSVIIKHPGANDAQKLELLANLHETHAPRLLAVHEDWLAETYISGRLMSQLPSLPGHSKRKYFDVALNQLVTIHSLLRDNKIDLSKLSKERMGDALRHLIYRDLHQIQEATSVPQESSYQWRKVVEGIMKEKSSVLFQELIQPDDSHLVLSHGDYKPDNLIIGNDDLCYPIDWVYMGKASCWYDLGYFITIPLSDQERPIYLDQYVQQSQQTRGQLGDLDERTRSLLYLKGRMCAEITMAGANAHNASNSNNSGEFSRAMKELDRLFSTYQDVVG